MASCCLIQGLLFSCFQRQISKLKTKKNTIVPFSKIVLIFFEKKIGLVIKKGVIQRGQNFAIFWPLTPAWAVFIPWAWTKTFFDPSPPYLVHVVIEWSLVWLSWKINQPKQTNKQSWVLKPTIKSNGLVLKPFQSHLHIYTFFQRLQLY